MKTPTRSRQYKQRDAEKARFDEGAERIMQGMESIQGFPCRFCGDPEAKPRLYIMPMEDKIRNIVYPACNTCYSNGAIETLAANR